MIPTLSTDRLILRAPSEADFEAEAEFFASEASHFVGGPKRPDETWRNIAMMLGHWAMRGYGFWGVEEKGTGTYVGRVGLWSPNGWPEPEIGWALMNGATGKGYATEAALMAREHAYNTLNWPTAISLIVHGNAPSRAVAERMGATYEQDYTHPQFGEMQIYRHPAPETLI